MLDEDYKYSIGITKEQWMGLLKDKDIVREDNLQLFTELYKYDKARASDLAQSLNKPHYNSFNLSFRHLGKRIEKKLKIQPRKWYDHKEKKEKTSWWNIPFWGEDSKEGFYWILRPELREAMREIYGEEALPLEITIPEEIDYDSYNNLYEGATKQIYVNVFERNRDARDKCIKHYKSQCIICQFDFEGYYGEVGRGVIHVHHLKPLSEIGEKYQVDPINDLRPVCPNCHVIIHKRNPPYTIDEVKAMIRNAKAE